MIEHGIVHVPGEGRVDTNQFATEKPRLASATRRVGPKGAGVSVPEAGLAFQSAATRDSLKGKVII